MPVLLMAVFRFSEREAGAAERAPEALEVVERRRAATGAAVVVAVDAAGVGAAARSMELLRAQPWAMTRSTKHGAKVARWIWKRPRVTRLTAEWQAVRERNARSPFD
jgi:hypothetical protein